MTRRTTLPADKLEEYKGVGNIVTEEASTSSATGQTRFRDDHLFLIESRHGKLVKEYSAFRSENEVLFAAGSRFKVLQVQHRGTGSTNSSCSKWTDADGRKSHT